MASDIREEPFENANQLWEYLSDPKKSEGSDDEVIYRGHANADWDLIPTILRGKSVALFQNLMGRPLKCEDQVWLEFQMLQSFIEGCDEAGVTVPSDSVRFRNINLTYRSFRDYYEVPHTWPNDDLVEVMAKARLHGLPTPLCA